MRTNSEQVIGRLYLKKTAGIIQNETLARRGNAMAPDPLCGGDARPHVTLHAANFSVAQAAPPEPLEGLPQEEQAE